MDGYRETKHFAKTLHLRPGDFLRQMHTLHSESLGYYLTFPKVLNKGVRETERIRKKLLRFGNQRRGNQIITTTQHLAHITLHSR